MKILLVSHAFPPYNSIGTVRVGKMAKYLHRFGHDVQVLTAVPQFLLPSLPVEIPEDHIHGTRWINLHTPAEQVGGGTHKLLERGDIPPGRIWRVLKTLLWRPYREIAGFPDFQIGWWPYAVAEGKRLMERWMPDVIYASGPPFTAFLVARSLSRAHGVPWVAELRDLWADCHYYEHTEARRRIERRFEHSVLSTASALVTVSEPLAEQLRRNYTAPVEVMLNAYDPEDFVGVPRREPEPDLFRIAFTGSLHPSFQSPEILFEAIGQSPALRERLRVDFYGYKLNFVRELAAKYHLHENVVVHGPVPYGESLEVQRNADALLIQLWSDPTQQGILTGKLFEYFGARRPILALGPHSDGAGRLIEERAAGKVASSPAEIQAVLLGWMEAKRVGGLPDLPLELVADLTRENQAARLAEFLDLVQGSAPVAAGG